jgi:TMEM175 potassium channel family protein
LEAFSDGVIAVAATLLVLGLVVPVPGPHHDGTLAHRLLADWPNYAAYVISFATIGIIWINHHAMIARLRQADHTILVLNLVLLLTIGFLPFATKLMATYIRQPHGQDTAAFVYATAFLLMSLAFGALNRHILLVKTDLLISPLDERARREVLVRSVSGIAPYVMAEPLAFVSPYITLGICAAIALYYGSPLASSSTR